MKNGIWLLLYKRLATDPEVEGNQTPFCNAGNFKPSSLIT
jgi:hypothetical protein